jgi:hypothetical protein
MARLNKDTWERLKADYVTGAYTLEMLAKKYGTTKGTISKRAKKEKWQKLSLETTAELVELEKGNKKKLELLKETKKETNIKEEYLEEAISEITDYQTYIHSLQLQATEKIKETLIDGKVEEIATTSGELGEIRVVERKLNPRELKSLVDAIDKAGQTLGVVQRFSNQQVNIQNNNTIDNKTLEVKIVKVNNNETIN